MTYVAACLDLLNRETADCVSQLTNLPAARLRLFADRRAEPTVAEAWTILGAFESSGEVVRYREWLRTWRGQTTPWRVTRVNDNPRYNEGADLFPQFEQPTHTPGEITSMRACGWVAGLAELDPNFAARTVALREALEAL